MPPAIARASFQRHDGTQVRSPGVRHENPPAEFRPNPELLAGRLALAQAIVITLIMIEVVVIAVMAGVILSIYRHTGSLNSSSVKSLKG